MIAKRRRLCDEIANGFKSLEDERMGRPEEMPPFEQRIENAHKDEIDKMMWNELMRLIQLDIDSTMRGNNGVFDIK